VHLLVCELRGAFESEALWDPRTGLDFAGIQPLDHPVPNVYRLHYFGTFVCRQRANAKLVTTAFDYRNCLIFVINQLNAQHVFYNKIIICLYMFRALSAHHEEVKLVLYSIWYRNTCRRPPDDEHIVLETCRGI